MLTCSFPGMIFYILPLGDSFAETSSFHQSIEKGIVYIRAFLHFIVISFVTSSGASCSSLFVL